MRGLDSASPGGSAGSTSHIAVLGVDGCPGGWVGARLLDDVVSVLAAPTIEDLVASALPVTVVGIDMPIGLADGGAPRAAEALARLRLPPGRKSSVFPTPMRSACEAATWTEANALNKATCGRGLSHQAFGLTRKIVEVDTWVRSRPAVRVVEVHPEVSFAAVEPTCVEPSKKTPAGREARVAALRAVGLELPDVRRGPTYAVDDLLDACAVAWSARRVALGSATCLPDPPQVFADGIPAAIWV